MSQFELPSDDTKYAWMTAKVSISVGKGAEGVQEERLVEDPAHNDRDGDDKDRNLDGRAQCHANCQVHLVLDGDEDGCDVLTGIASNWQYNKPQEGLIETRLLADIL